jgi:ABC-type branched-subunit amino acid transport system substrate-binding protein
MKASRLGFAALTAAAFAFAATQAGAQAQQPPLKLGQLVSMTGGGAALGLAANVGVKLALKEINDSGGILGRRVDLILGDDQSDPTAAVNEANRLVNLEKIDVMIGPLLSQYVLATLPLTTKAKILQLTTGGSLALTPQAGPYHFAMIANAGTQGIAMVDYAVDVMKAKSVAFLGDNGGNSKDTAQYALQRIAERKIQLTGQAEYPYRADDFTPQMLNLRRGNPDLLLFNTVSPEDLAGVLRTRKDLGWNVRIVGGQSTATFGANAAKIVGAAAFEGVTGEANIGLTYCTNDPLGQSAYSKYLVRLKAFAPGEEGKYSPSSASYQYDLVYVLKAAAEGAKSFDAAKMAEWLETNGSKLVALSGPLSPSKTSHFLLGPSAVASVERPYEARSDGLQKRAGC